jgi:hypothetical protein
MHIKFGKRRQPAWAGIIKQEDNIKIEVEEIGHGRCVLKWFGIRSSG